MNKKQERDIIINIVKEEIEYATFLSKCDGRVFYVDNIQHTAEEIADSLQKADFNGAERAVSEFSEDLKKAYDYDTDSYGEAVIPISKIDDVLKNWKREEHIFDIESEIQNDRMQGAKVFSEKLIDNTISYIVQNKSCKKSDKSININDLCQIINDLLKEMNK